MAGIKARKPQRNMCYIVWSAGRLREFFIALFFFSKYVALLEKNRSLSRSSKAGW